MSYLTIKDGTQIYYKDWGPKTGQLVVFSHSWPLCSDAWENQMFFLASHGCRCIAHDRRGHGRSSQPARGNDMNTYSDDLAQLFEALDLQGATMIGHSAGGGEVARYIGRHGTKRVAKAILVSSTPPLLLKTAANPDGLPLEAFDAARESYAADRSQFFLEAVYPYYGYNRPGARVSQGNIKSFWRQGMMGGFRNLYEGIEAWSETDFTEDLKKFDVPALVIHGDDDQGVPIDVTGRAAARLIPGAELIVYAGAPHGLPVTHNDRLNTDLLTFLKS